MRWGELVEEGSKIVLTGNGHEAEYVFGKVYKYFLGQFGIDDAKKGGQFYAPASVLKICFEVLTACRQKLRSMLAVRGMFVQPNTETATRNHYKTDNNLCAYTRHPFYSRKNSALKVRDFCTVAQQRISYLQRLHRL